MSNLFWQSEAEFSADRIYRYTLTRTWDPSLPKFVVIGLNPSTADETQNDPTISRCIKRARALGFGGLVMLNIFAFKSTQPEKLYTSDSPIGQENDLYLLRWCDKAGIILLAWGKHGRYQDRGRRVISLLENANFQRKMKCLGVTKDNYPLHPLYQLDDAELLPYTITYEEFEKILQERKLRKQKTK